MGWFTSSASSTSSQASTQPNAPNRQERRACWTSRDAYFNCLTSHDITVPPGTDMSNGRGLVGKAAAEEQKRLEREKGESQEKALREDPCVRERGVYEEHCARSWIDYFNKRRVLEERQKLMYAQAEEGNAARAPSSSR
ncbi:hypothetical protein K437DRAFT_256168 [Tilletiaria anomala UBC 951]|uniref:Cytochrome c oxidase, subunit VIb n=1 Tax=Tilletiaria anomala (strain ATCC 24038 / CBS 436.72 / UBC 951) TaxID=1037660 RepID=A0A066W1M0_TILAU|nr:uncharacterized protein K437DRAFT_256168 [Tilletiaria anomala UBC 951]KDN46443.1 hypothetical protein K437DRAFT_256168 [Tilletiaria anomala UBC 951]